MGNAKAATVKKKKTASRTVKAKPNKKPVQKPVVSVVKDQNIRHLSEKNDILPDIEIDFCGITVKGRLHTFLLYYLTPGQYCFHNARQAAMKAGYSESTASAVIYGVLRKPEIQKIITANENLAAYSLHEAAKRAIEIKKQRAFYDPADYFEEKEIPVVKKNGDVIVKKVNGLKDLKDMTLEQRLCIDGMDIKGNASIPIYQMPDRKKELDDIIKIDAEYSKSIGGSGEEETREIIMERITIRETKRAQRPSGIEYEIMQDPVETAEETEI